MTTIMTMITGTIMTMATIIIPIRMPATRSGRKAWKRRGAETGLR